MILTRVQHTNTQLVPLTGLEPALLSRLILSQVCLPVPPQGQILILSFGQVSFYELITVSFVVKTGLEPVTNETISSIGVEPILSLPIG